MGRVRNAVHRAGPLKQSNKKHKSGRHRSKGVIESETRGRISSAGSVSKSRKAALSRSERRRQEKANRGKRIQVTLEQKRMIGGHRGAPLFVSIIPLSGCSNTGTILRHILATIKNDVKVVGNQTEDNTLHLTLGNGKKLTLCVPASNDLWTLLDTMKMSDVTLFHMPILETLSEEGKTLLKAAKDQGINSPFIGVTAPFVKVDEKMFLKHVSKLFVSVPKVYPLQTKAQLLNVFRIISATKLQIGKNWALRSAMLIENVHSFVMDPTVVPHMFPALQPQTMKIVKVTGYVRRQNLNPQSLVHIAGVGDFRIMRVDAAPAENISELKMGQASSEPTIAPWFLYDPANQVEEEDEQVDDEMLSDSDIDEDQVLDDFFGKPSFSGDADGTVTLTPMECEGSSQTNQRRLPKGTSAYQADWIDNSDSERGSLINSDDEIESENKSQQDDSDDEDDDEMDWAEEQEQLKKAKAARIEAEFPDWIDTPMDTPAKVRFQRYRGLQSFKKTPWDPNENLPREYSKIVQFQNFRQTYKKILSGDPDGFGFIPVGHRVSMQLVPVGEGAVGFQVEAINATKPVALFSHFRHENKMSVLNIQLNITDVLKNKEELIFQVGFRRFQAKPILSEISTGNKHKMLRFAQANTSCMATIIAPIVFPNASVLVFKAEKSTLIPVGSGHIFSVDPTRIVVKRVLLSGCPFRSHGRKAVVRFMFFNREDIEWFKPVELRTRYGQRGHIKEPLGTHGRMKCVFDGIIKSQDTVLMPLYKRVFPKLNYDPTVLPYTVYDSYEIKPSRLSVIG